MDVDPLFAGNGKPEKLKSYGDRMHNHRSLANAGDRLLPKALSRTHFDDRFGSQTGTLQRSYDKAYDLAGRVTSETDSLANSIVSSYEGATNTNTVTGATLPFLAAGSAVSDA